MEHYSHAVLSSARAPHASGNAIPLIFVTIAFFMWGLLTSMNDVVIPHLKAVYMLTYVQAMLVQLCFFGAYFIVSLPAGMLIRKIGCQSGIVAGLTIAAAGCVLFCPAANSGYTLFLITFFVLAGGIAILQVAANSYVTVLGDAQTASSRLTLTHAFNSFGATVAPILGGMLIIADGVLSSADLAKLPLAVQGTSNVRAVTNVQWPYFIMAVSLLALATVFEFSHLSKIADAEQVSCNKNSWRAVLRHRRLLLGTVAVFLYVGAEVSIGSFLISFMGDPTVLGLAASDAAPYVSYYWGSAMVGRFIGFLVMRKVSPSKALAFNSMAAIALVLLATLSGGRMAMWSILAVGLCNSIMFPTIFSMSLNKLGSLTEQGSGMLCMAIVGGALVPFVQGFLADRISLKVSFLVPAACYTFVLYFGLKYSNMYKDEAI
jgi:FHS family L-fucose permease-like MFS transporter